MAVSDKTRWRKWADDLRQTMMSDLEPQVTKSVNEIANETGTDKTSSVLHSSRFWSSCQAGKAPNETLVKAGFEIEIEPNGENEIDTVTLRLNETWKGIMQRVLDRQQ